MIETIINFSRGKTKQTIPTDDFIYKKFIDLKNKESFDQIIFNNGHDFSEIICLGLKKALGSKDIEPDIFLKDNILNYESTDFVKTEMYLKIKQLEKTKNTQFLKV